MVSSADADRVRRVVGPVVAAAGLYLEDVLVRPAGKRSLVQVVVDLEADATGGLDADRLADVHREISNAMDAADVVAGPHVLEVTTPGTDRPLTQPRHYRRARGRLVTLRRRDGAIVAGRVVAVDDDGVSLLVEDILAPVVVLFTDIASGRVEVELTRLGDPDALDDDDLLDDDLLDDDLLEDDGGEDDDDRDDTGTHTDPEQEG